jgi:CSLREA domain-containing protein
MRIGSFGVSPLRRCMVLLAALLVSPMPTSAADFTVDTTADALDAVPGDGTCATASGGCTLRAAIQETNALPGADTITLPAGTYLLTLGSGDADANGDLDVSDALSIAGAGAATTIVDANHASRVFDVQMPPSLPFALSGITVQNGDAAALPSEGPFGGGIMSLSAPVSVTDCLVTGNHSLIGGGIAVLNGLSLTNVTVSGNTADTAGGGVATVFGTIRNSTFTGNTVASPTTLGGRDVVTNGAGTLTILDSTIEDEIRNVALCLPQPPFECDPGTDIVLSNTTVGSLTFLSAGPGGSFTARNSIIRTCESGVTLTSQGHNLIEVDNCPIIGDPTGNLVGVDPLLGPLADNGGPTATHEPLPGSPVLDAGDPAAPGSGGTACEATDQRGVARPQGTGCDIGAVERLVCNPCLVPDGTACVLPSCGLVPATRAALSLTRGATPDKSRLSYRWRGALVAKADFGDPRLVTPHLCLYDGGGSVLMAAFAPEDGCDGHPCWRETPRGYRYRDRDLTPSGLASLSLAAGSTGSVTTKGRGALLLSATSPFSPPVRLRLFGEVAGPCFGADFDAGIRTNTDRAFRAVVP